MNDSTKKKTLLCSSKKNQRTLDNSRQKYLAIGSGKWKQVYFL